MHNKEYLKTDIEVDADIAFTIDQEKYVSKVDLIVSAENVRFMVFKCAAGSLGSCEREALAAARIVDDYQIPFAVVSDGKTAIVMDTITGKTIGEGFEAVWSKEDAIRILKDHKPVTLPEKRRVKERLIFRSYDSMNINVARNT